MLLVLEFNNFYFVKPSFLAAQRTSRIITITITAVISIFIKYPIKFPTLPILKIWPIFTTNAIISDIKNNFLSWPEVGKSFIELILLSIVIMIRKNLDCQSGLTHFM